MARTKISEFSATPANNTDIDSINIAEGCAPSGINDAIRELMAQLKDFQTGAVGDSFNGPIGATTASTGAFTTLSSTGNTTLGDASGDAVTINGTATFANANPTLTAGTANGVTYLNGSKVLTSGSDFIFNANGLGVGAAPNTSPGSPYYNLNVGTLGGGGIISGGTDTYFTNNLYISGNNYFAYTGGSAYGSYYNQTGGNHTWKTSTAAGTGGNVATLNTLMTLNSNGALALFGGASANGVGITFPATQSASSNANTLDDYEEGTWTPNSGGTATYTTQNGTYTKIGNKVTVHFVFQVNLILTGSANSILGLPFTASASAGSQSGHMSYATGLTSNQIFIGGYVGASGTTFITTSSGAASSSVTTNNIIGNGTLLIGDITYFI